MRRPNIIWIFPDEWRHDAVGYAGNEVIQTPNLDALAARGTAFTHAYCESPVCAPSRASLLTGTFPRDHGKVQNGWDAGEFPGPDAPSFLHALQDAGYRTAEVGKMHFFDRLHSPAELQAYGFDDVAEEYDKIMLRRDFIETPYTRYLDQRGLLESWRKHQDEQTELMFGRDPHGRRALPEALDAEHALDAFIGRQVCNQVEEYAQGEQPFFLWAAFVGPHIPFDGPPPFADLYDPADIPMGPLGFDPLPTNQYGEYITVVRDLMGSADCTEDDYRLMAKHYYASISLLDEQIGAIVEAVDAAGIEDDTWILFSSDHGELLGDHGLLTKGVFYESSVRVPALVVPPRGRRPAQRIVGNLVQGLDIPATILDIAGTAPVGLGQSLLQVGDLPGREAVFSQIANLTMVTTDRHKLVVTSDTLEPQALYDLAHDPDERTDLHTDPAHADTIADLMAQWVKPFASRELPSAPQPAH